MDAPWINMSKDTHANLRFGSIPQPTLRYPTLDQKLCMVVFVTVLDCCSIELASAASTWVADDIVNRKVCTCVDPLCEP